MTGVSGNEPDSLSNGDTSSLNSAPPIDPSSSNDSPIKTGTINEQQPQPNDELARLQALLAQAEQVRDNASSAFNDDQRAIEQNRGVLNSIQVRIENGTAQEEALAERIAALSPETRPGDAMVAAYLENQYDQLQQQEIYLNASEAQYEKAIADGERLAAEHERINEAAVLRIAQLNAAIQALQQPNAPVPPSSE